MQNERSKISVVVEGEIHPQQVEALIEEEIERWNTSGRQLAKIVLTQISEEEIEVKSYPVSPIKRVRRITGYLAPLDNWNAAKKAELADRQPCDVLNWKDEWGVLDGQF